MANESPKRPIRRVPVPSTSKKEVSKILPTEAKESNVGQNVLLLVLFLLVAGLVYVAIFRKDIVAKFSPSKSTPSTALPSDSIAVDSTSAEEEVATVLGQKKKNNNTGNSVISNNIQPGDYPAGTKYYLVVGSYIFYPYAEKCKARMLADGFNAEIITSGEERKFYRIYIESSEDVTAMNARRDELISSKGLNVWVYAE